MKFPTTLVGRLLVLASLASAAAAETIVIVNGKAIPSIRLEALENNALAGGTPAQQQPRAELIKKLVDLELASQEFDKLGLASDALFQSRLELTRQGQILQKLVFYHVAKNIPSDADIQAAFESATGSFTGTDTSSIESRFAQNPWSRMPSCGSKMMNNLRHLQRA